MEESILLLYTSYCCNEKLGKRIVSQRKCLQFHVLTGNYDIIFVHLWDRCESLEPQNVNRYCNHERSCPNLQEQYSSLGPLVVVLEAVPPRISYRSDTRYIQVHLPCKEYHQGGSKPLNDAQHQ